MATSKVGETPAPMAAWNLYQAPAGLVALNLGAAPVTKWEMPYKCKMLVRGDKW